MATFTNITNNSNRVLFKDLFAGADLIDGTGGGDRIFGWAGRDTISGEGGADSIRGDSTGTAFDPDLPDSDAVNFADSIAGGAGNDSVWGGGGADTIFGDSGNDKLYGQGGADEIDGGSGNDAVNGGEDNDLGRGGSGNDFLFGGPGRDTLFGDDGNDKLYGLTTAAEAARWGWTTDDGNEMHGGAGNDTLIGAGGTDTMWGDAGNDRLTDETTGGPIVESELHGGSGNDRLIAKTRASGEEGEGNTALFGDDGNDTLNVETNAFGSATGFADTTVDGGDGSDRIAVKVEAGQSEFAGGAGVTIYGGAGNDRIASDARATGGQGAGVESLIDAGDGNDRVTLSARAGGMFEGTATTVVGGAGNDTIAAAVGGAPYDDSTYRPSRAVLDGGDGNDILKLTVAEDDEGYIDATLTGGLGNDTLTGGTYGDQVNNLFVFAAGDGKDVVTNFHDGTDLIGLAGGLSFADLRITAAGTSTLIEVTATGEDLVLLKGVNASLIGAGDVVGIIEADPDEFAVGQDLTNAFPGVTLSVEDEPGTTVIAADGVIANPGPGGPPGPHNFATTGTRVFGQDPADSPTTFAGKPVWDEDNHGLLRIDFDTPTNFVEIDFAFDDDDVGTLKAFNADGQLIEEVFGSGDGRGDRPTVTLDISRETADIAYALAGGANAEALYMDNLHYHLINANSLSAADNFVLV